MTVEEVAEAVGGEVVAGPAVPVRRLLLALDWVPGLGDAGADAVLLHRSFGAAPPAGLGVLGLHDPFDAQVVPWLAAAAGLRDLEPLGDRSLIGNGPPGLARRVRDLLGGCERFEPGDGRDPGRVVVAGAMTDPLVREAAARGATLYVTGQWRPAADAAVRETGIAVLACGHRRQEEWALEVLAGRLRGVLAGVDVATAAF